jgi:hypothetical protein
MPKRKRTYNIRLIKATVSYSPYEIAILFGLHKNAVLRWKKDGLQTIDGRKPYLIRGNILKAFLDERQKNRKQKCAADEFFCVRCRAPCRAREGQAEVVFERLKIIRLKAICALCGTPMNKAQSAKNLAEIMKIFYVQKLEGSHISGCIDPSVNSDTEKPDETAANKPKK